MMLNPDYLQLHPSVLIILLASCYPLFDSNNQRIVSIIFYGIDYNNTHYYYEYSFNIRLLFMNYYELFELI